MSAPLFSRFRRMFDRDTKPVMKENPRLLKSMNKFRGQARVYSLTPAAATELGAFSMQPPDVLLEALYSLRLPDDFLWIEMDHRASYDGLLQAGGAVGTVTDDNPTRIGYLVFAEDTIGRRISALTYVLYPNGRTGFGAGLHCLLTDPGDGVAGPLPAVLRDKVYEATGLDLHKVGVGQGYAQINAKKPRLLDTLAAKLGCLDFMNIANTNPRHFIECMTEINGTTRMVLAALTLVSTAKGKPQAPAGNQSPKDGVTASSGHSAGSRSPLEVDIYIRPGARPGKSLLKQFRAAERKKKGLHDVAGHWSYRNRSDGADPTVCPYGRHQFEKIFDDRTTEVCCLCSQKRWFKSKHQRGDAAFGVIPPKVYNVRLSA